MKEGILQHKKTIILVALAIAVALLSIFLIRSRSEMSKQGKEQEGALNYKSITPGSTTKEDALSILGDPTDQSKNEGFTNYQFTSPVEARPHEAVFEGEKLLLFKETVNLNKTANDIKNKYGEASNILYQSQVVGGFALYVYPDKGVAYLGDTSSKNIVTEIWYFEPTNIEEFKSKWATDYYDTLPSEDNPPEDYMY